jgi:hypothetical protein
MGKKAIKLAIFNLTENSRKKESMKKERINEERKKKNGILSEEIEEEIRRN